MEGEGLKFEGCGCVEGEEEGVEVVDLGCVRFGFSHYRL